jgi:hypothetical protein
MCLLFGQTSGCQAFVDIIVIVNDDVLIFIHHHHTS